MNRVLSFMAIVILVTLLPWWLWLPLVAVYVFYFEGVEVVLVGVAADAYLSPGIGLPFYTLIAATLTIIVLTARPFISV